MNLLMWPTFGAPNSFAGYLTLYSSAALFAVVSGLSLFYPKVASVIALLGVIGTAALQRALLAQVSWADKKDSAVALAGLLLFVITIVNSVKKLLNKGGDEMELKKGVRIGLAVIPFLLFVYWLVMAWMKAKS
jgi:hypothetical protein